MSQMPDKVFIHKHAKYNTDDFVIAYQYDFAENVQNEGVENFVEYVNKNIFIEKLLTWIKENSEMYIECEDHFYAGWLTEDFYKELRKAMSNET